MQAEPRRRRRAVLDNADIARSLSDVADLLEIQGANPFRVRAYRNAVHVVADHPVPLQKLLADGFDLTELPSVGTEMAKHIRELTETGGLALLAELSAEVPHSLVHLTRLSGVGPKRARKLWQELDVSTIDELETAARAGEVARLDGFGAKTESKILASIEAYRRRRGRFRLAEIDARVAAIIDWMRQSPDLERIEAAGSYRRRCETVGDIDLLALARRPGRVMAHFTGFPGTSAVQASGETKSSIRLHEDLQVDLRIVPAESWGAALVYFTGSREHNIQLRRRALDHGLTVSEYGVFRLEDPESAAAAAASPPEAGDPAGAAADEARDGKGTRARPTGERVAGETEEDVYDSLGLPWIAPELREHRGEIDAAEEGRLPSLIGPGDFRGDVHMHSIWSDGGDSVEEMLEACVARGYEYFAITDHSKALAMTGGLDAARLRAQWEEMEGIAARHGEIRMLRGMEVDILADGELDLEDELLAELDVVVVSVHSRFELPAEAQTARILRAIRHPEVNILAHPTGRIINRREPSDFNLDAVLEAAAEHNVAVELNAHPHRLDLKDTHLMRAREHGVKVVINTDAHRTAELDLMSYGVEQARRAWLERADVLNTLPLPEFLEALQG